MKKLFLCLSTAAVSGAIGYFLGVRAGEKKAELLSDRIDDYYDISEEYRRCDEEDEDKEEFDENSGVVENEHLSFRNGKSTDQKNWKAPDKTDYAKIYKTKEDTVETDIAIPPAIEEAIKDHEENFDKDPEIVDGTVLASLPEHLERQTFFLYKFDETITNEDNEIVDDPDILFGATLEDSGFYDNDEEVLYVRNYQTDCVYVIYKHEASFSYDEI